MIEMNKTVSDIEGMSSTGKANIVKTEKKYKISIPENCDESLNIILPDESEINIIVGMNSNVKILGDLNGEVNIFVGENSRVDFISVIGDKRKNIKSAEVEKNGVINWLDCCLFDSESFIKTRLIGEGSETESLTVIFGNGKEVFNMGTEVVHVASNSRSNMLTRMVLDNESNAKFNGLVRVNKNARNCEGYQKKETILLSENARVDAVPNLEIENNEVKCSHGATITQIDDDKLFYLMSRGLSKMGAKKSIVEGFFEPILVKIENDSRRESLRREISQRLDGGKNE